MEQAFAKDMSGADWDKVYDRQTRRADLAPAWMAAIGLQPGDRVLEVGAGPGFFSLMLAERVGPDGRVYAVDRSADALACLERRQRERGITHIRRIVADVATLDEDLAADCALATMVLHHCDDAAALVRNLGRLLRPGASVVFAEFHPDGPCEVGAPRPDRVAPERLESWCAEAGLAVVAYQRQTPEHYLMVAQRTS